MLQLDYGDSPDPFFFNFGGGSSSTSADSAFSLVMIKLVFSLLQYISVCVMPDQMMSFAGTEEPCALMHIGSIGKLGVEENKKLSEIIFKLIKEKLNIEGTR